mmetsp:Transcript_79772/g.220599  ORF Transcript_79772/g.220599 Transcript_79772/m.220599 type:complete len:232 (-) Transcript_79772:133-828(-)
MPVPAHSVVFGSASASSSGVCGVRPCSDLSRPLWPLGCGGVPNEPPYASSSSATLAWSASALPAAAALISRRTGVKSTSLLTLRISSSTSVRSTLALLFLICSMSGVLTCSTSGDRSTTGRWLLISLTCSRSGAMSTTGQWLWISLMMGEKSIWALTFETSSSISSRRSAAAPWQVTLDGSSVIPAPMSWISLSVSAMSLCVPARAAEGSTSRLTDWLIDWTSLSSSVRSG